MPPSAAQSLGVGRRLGYNRAMRSFIIRAVVCGLGLWLASALHVGVGFDSTRTLIIAAVLLGLANAIVRPIFFFLTLPLTILTLGLFIFIVNGAMVGLVAWLLHPGMKVNSWWDAVVTAVIIGLTGWVVSWFVGGEKARSVRSD